MTKDVLISVKGTQLMEGDSDVVEMIIPGSWFEKNGKQYLIYEESIAESEELTKNTVKVYPDKIEVTKRGLVDSHMTFECGRKHMANYSTPIGLIVLGLTTSALEIETDERELHVAITYSLEMNGEYVSNCRLELTAKERGEGNFSLT